MQVSLCVPQLCRVSAEWKGTQLCFLLLFLNQITVDWAKFFQCTLPPIDAAASGSCGVGSSLYQSWMSRVWAYRLCSARLIHADEGDARFSARVRLMTLSCWCLCVVLGGILAKLNEDGSL